MLVQGGYGRGGGNFVKKPKPVAPIDASAKSSSLKSSGKVSLLKKIANVLPGSQSKISGTSANQSPRGTLTRHTNSRKTHISSLSSNSNKILSSRRPPLPPATHSSHPVIVDTNRRRMPPINLNTITPGSSDDESNAQGHFGAIFRPIDILASRQPSTDNEGTAVNEVPVSRTANAPVVVAPGERVRFTNTSDRSRRPTMPPQPKREELNQHDPKALAALERKPDSSTGSGHRIHRLASIDSEHKKGRRTTLATPAISRSNATRRPVSEFSPFTDLLSLKLNEPPRRWSRNTTAATTPPSDPFNQLFISCAISLFLLIILAAGKDILYVVALLPVIMTLAKHFLDLGQLGLYTPLMRENLESLLSI